METLIRKKQDLNGKWKQFKSNQFSQELIKSCELISYHKYSRVCGF